LAGKSAEAALLTVAGLKELCVGNSTLKLGRISKGKD